MKYKITQKGYRLLRKFRSININPVEIELAESLDKIDSESEDRLVLFANLAINGLISFDVSEDIKELIDTGYEERSIEAHKIEFHSIDYELDYSYKIDGENVKVYDVNLWWNEEKIVSLEYEENYTLKELTGESLDEREAYYNQVTKRDEL